MKKKTIPTKLKFYAIIILIAITIFPSQRLLAQLPNHLEAAINDYYSEIVKVYKLVDSEEIEVAINKIEGLVPSIEKKARIIGEIIAAEPEYLEFIDSEEFDDYLAQNPHIQEIMTMMQNEAFARKLMTSKELLAKIEEIEGIIETYTTSDNDPSNDELELPSGIAFTITLNGNGKFSGSYQVNADFEEGAVAFIDDLEYLRIEIFGDYNGNEASASFFVDNTGTGRQEWATEGHFIFEIMDSDGEILFSLYGSEEMGYFDITRVDGPGGWVTGRIIGKCEDGNDESGEIIPISADFKVKYIDINY
jgi:hypothetical protein